jgi:hypothetical protein
LFSVAHKPRNPQAVGKDAEFSFDQTCSKASGKCSMGKAQNRKENQEHSVYKTRQMAVENTARKNPRKLEILYGKKLVLGLKDKIRESIDGH